MCEKCTHWVQNRQNACLSEIRVEQGQFFIEFLTYKVLLSIILLATLCAYFHAALSFGTDYVVMSWKTMATSTTPEGSDSQRAKDNSLSLSYLATCDATIQITMVIIDNLSVGESWCFVKPNSVGPTSHPNND